MESNAGERRNPLDCSVWAINRLLAVKASVVKYFVGRQLLRAKGVKVLGVRTGSCVSVDVEMEAGELSADGMNLDVQLCH